MLPITVYCSFTRSISIIKEPKSDDYKSVKKLYLQWCNIQSITENSFEELDQLEAVFLSFNDNLVIDTSPFMGIKKLKSIHRGTGQTMSHNGKRVSIPAFASILNTHQNRFVEEEKIKIWIYDMI